MSTVNYSLKNRGVRLIPADKAWVSGKKGQRYLNPKYAFVGKVDTKLPNVIISASDKQKPKYKGNTYDLNSIAKRQMVSHFYDDNGKRNKKTLRILQLKKINSLFPERVTIKQINRRKL